MVMEAAVIGGVAGAVAGSVADKTIVEVVPGLGTPTVTASEPSIINIDLVTADAEEEYRVPVGCKMFMMHMRDGTAFKVATVKDGTTTKRSQYWTVRTDGTACWDSLNVKDPKQAVFYLACGTASKVVEIWQWS